MERTKWAIEFRNKIAELAMELSSCAAKIVPEKDRENCKDKLRAVVKKFDKLMKIGKD